MCIVQKRLPNANGALTPAAMPLHADNYERRAAIRTETRELGAVLSVLPGLLQVSMPARLSTVFPPQADFAALVNVKSMRNPVPAPAS